MTTILTSFLQALFSSAKKGMSGSYIALVLLIVALFGFIAYSNGMLSGMFAAVNPSAPPATYEECNLPSAPRL